MSYDLIIVGSGFAGSFFLRNALRHLPESARVLVLERGGMNTHPQQLDMRANSPIDHETLFRRTGDPHKTWRFNIGFGGGSNCWWAGTPRMLPSDFRMQSTYGVGIDWPFDYDELEPYYCDAENIMSVAGHSDVTPFERSQPYPLPPHRLTAPEEVLSKAYPGEFFRQPTARASRATSTRPRCCANGVCNLCPVNAKFTIENSLKSVYDDPRVELRTGARVTDVKITNGVATGVAYQSNGKTTKVQAETVVLAANAIFNAHLLQASGFRHPQLGRRLHEQVSFNAVVDLDGLDNFQGSTSVTGHGYMLYDGEHRREAGATLIETWNVPNFRAEQGKWRQRLELYVIVEDLPLHENHVAMDPKAPRKPVTHFERHSDYALRGVERAQEKLPSVLSCLPIEKIEYTDLRDTDSHILGTTVMGNDPDTSVLDHASIAHNVRNLLVLGSSAFPTGAPANPTLTLSAMALRSAERYYA